MLFVVRPKRSMPSRTWPGLRSGASPSTKRVCCRSSLRTWKSMQGSLFRCELALLALRREQGAVGRIVETERVPGRRGHAVRGGDRAVPQLGLGERLGQSLGGDL